MRTSRRPDPLPLQTDDVRTVAVGTGLWALLGLGLLLFGRGFLADHDATWWLWVPAWGVLLGLLGVRFCMRRAAAIARDRADGIPQRQ